LSSSEEVSESEGARNGDDDMVPATKRVFGREKAERNLVREGRVK
jgi:hypothetical protein